MLYIGMFVQALIWDRYDTYSPVTGYIGKWIVGTGFARITAIQGQYVKLFDLSSDTEKWHNRKRIVEVLPSEMPRAMRVYERMIERKHDARLAESIQQRRKDVRALSQNTVTRALVHAADNGYCNETVIALISAGHKMPEGTVTVKVTVNVPVELDGADQSDYYIMRGIFGRTRGNLDKIVGEGIGDDEGRFSQKLYQKLEQIGAMVNWNEADPTVVSHHIRFPEPTIRPIEDVQTAPAAHYQGDDSDY